MSVNEFIKIGEKLKMARKEKGLTQREMATRLGLSYSTYSNYENNYREPGSDVIDKACAILGISIKELFFKNEINPAVDAPYLQHEKFTTFLYDFFGYGFMAGSYYVLLVTKDEYVGLSNEDYKAFYQDVVEYTNKSMVELLKKAKIRIRREEGIEKFNEIRDTINWET